MYNLLPSLLLSSAFPLLASAANLDNWEGPHLDVSTDSRAIDWWYTQVIGQTAASNGIPTSLEILFKQGNPFQFGTTNTPLYLIDVHGFDGDGQRFAHSLIFNESSVSTDDQGQTVGSWSGDIGKGGFLVSSDLKNFTISLETDAVSGTVVIPTSAHYRTACGSEDLDASPFFDGLVSDGRQLTDAETVLYKETGWRITAPASNSFVDLTIDGKKVSFSGAGYKDSTWSSAALNDFIRSWYIILAQVGPYSLVTFSGQPKEGTNKVNVAHLLKDGEYLTSSCTIIGEQDAGISVITPVGETLDVGTTAPTAFDIKFLLEDGKQVSFHATNLAENPAASVYHRWVAKYVGGAERESFESFGLTEWMNPANLTEYELLQ